MTHQIFLDLDGTVYLSGAILDDVDFELRRLADSGSKIYYMTNNTSLSSDEYSAKLSRLGLPMHSESLISPTIVLSKWLRASGIRKVFAVGTDAFCHELAERTGVSVSSSNADCVIVAFDKELTYAKLEEACSLINSGIPWYLTHIDLACPSPRGPIPDCGAIGRLIEATTGASPVGHFGKPGNLMLDFLRQKIGTGSPAIVAGDRLYTDAEVGLQLGARTIVVCTGEFQPGHTAIDPRIEVFNTLTSFLKLI